MDYIPPYSYYNFPIELIHPIMTNDVFAMREAVAYTIIRWIEKDKMELTNDNVRDKLDRLDVDAHHVYNPQFLIHDMDLIEEKMANKKQIFTSVKAEKLNDAMHNEKTEWDRFMLAAYCAITSIIQRKPYQLIKYPLIYSRIAGFDRVTSSDKFPPLVRKYNTRHYQIKMRDELERYWSVKMFKMDGAQGIFMSTRLSEEKLIRAVLKKSREYERNKKQRDKHALIARIKKELDGELGLENNG